MTDLDLIEAVADALYRVQRSGPRGDISTRATLNDASIGVQTWMRVQAQAAIYVVRSRDRADWLRGRSADALGNNSTREDWLLAQGYTDETQPARGAAKNPSD